VRRAAAVASKETVWAGSAVAGIRCSCPPYPRQPCDWWKPMGKATPRLERCAPGAYVAWAACSSVCFVRRASNIEALQLAVFLFLMLGKTLCDPRFGQATSRLGSQLPRLALRPPPFSLMAMRPCILSRNHAEKSRPSALSLALAPVDWTAFQPV